MMNNNIRRENTPYESIYKYIAPEGYEFWVGNDCFGNVIWGKEVLDNPYYLKEINKHNN